MFTDELNSIYLIFTKFYKQFAWRMVYKVIQLPFIDDN